MVTLLSALGLPPTVPYEPDRVGYGLLGWSASAPPGYTSVDAPTAFTWSFTGKGTIDVSFEPYAAPDAAPSCVPRIDDGSIVVLGEVHGTNPSWIDCRVARPGGVLVMRRYANGSGPSGRYRVWAEAPYGDGAAMQAAVDAVVASVMWFPPVLGDVAAIRGAWCEDPQQGGVMSRMDLQFDGQGTVLTTRRYGVDGAHVYVLHDRFLETLVMTREEAGAIQLTSDLAGAKVTPGPCH